MRNGAQGAGDAPDSHGQVARQTATGGPTAWPASWTARCGDEPAADLHSECRVRFPTAVAPAHRKDEWCRALRRGNAGAVAGHSRPVGGTLRVSHRGGLVDSGALMIATHRPPTLRDLDTDRNVECREDGSARVPGPSAGARTGACRGSADSRGIAARRLRTRRGHDRQSSRPSQPIRGLDAGVDRRGYTSLPGVVDGQPAALDGDPAWLPNAHLAGRTPRHSLARPRPTFVRGESRMKRLPCNLDHRSIRLARPGRS